MGDVYRAFIGSIPEHYDRYLVPLVFEPQAADLAARVPPVAQMSVLELACGTGVLTAKLAGALPADARITATDLNEAMIDIARAKLGADERISWQSVDATTLPFADRSFDAVVCQFGVMFFADRRKALREALRVLRPGGWIIFNVWDRLARCPVFAAADEQIRAAFPDDPPRFYEVPFGLLDREPVGELVRAAGFEDVAVATVKSSGARLPARDIATGIICGGPFVTEINQRGGDVDAVIEAVTKKLVELFGTAPFAS
ncbi:MAG: methyltransferase domain-containing protein, partial [Candidatus Eremiobacteraeota bacterium]|nr:methyltransferase domain-containing protein [Candidatus Eremiobacteraeota bacterium]